MKGERTQSENLTMKRELTFRILPATRETVLRLQGLGPRSLSVHAARRISRRGRRGRLRGLRGHIDVALRDNSAAQDDDHMHSACLLGLVFERITPAGLIG